MVLIDPTGRYPVAAGMPQFGQIILDPTIIGEPNSSLERPIDDVARYVICPAGRCLVKSFFVKPFKDADTSGKPGAGQKRYKTVIMGAAFVNLNVDCRLLQLLPIAIAALRPSCRCCEYRQYVQELSHFRVLPDTNWRRTNARNWGVWVEDEKLTVSYGHRGVPPRATLDEYSDPDRMSGCKYRGVDLPGILLDEWQKVANRLRRTIEVDYEAEFEGYIVDVCNLDAANEPLTVDLKNWPVRIMATINPS